MKTPRFLAACRREETDKTPVWFMRQAGRYMAEYRAIRAGRTFLEVSKTPELCTEVTLQPIRAFDLDAAIIFADIMTPLEGIGIDFDIEPGVGPVVEKKIQTLDDVRALTKFDPSSVDFLATSIENVTNELAGETPLIGFAGAPFTLACYLIQGRPVRDFPAARTVMFQNPELWSALINALVDMDIEYLKLQVSAGAQAVQIFDSWVGLLSPSSYRRFLLNPMKRLFAGIADLGVPRIHFGTGTSNLLGIMREAGGDVIGLDWRIGVDEGWRRAGHDRAVQGNLDPTVLLTDHETIEREIGLILKEAGGRPGHIFNVGHGIHRTTPPEHVGFAVDTVHRLSAR